MDRNFERANTATFSLVASPVNGIVQLYLHLAGPDLRPVNGVRTAVIGMVDHDPKWTGASYGHNGESDWFCISFRPPVDLASTIRSVMDGLRQQTGEDVECQWVVPGKMHVSPEDWQPQRLWNADQIRDMVKRLS